MQESFGKRDTVFHTRTWGQWIMYQARRRVQISVPILGKTCHYRKRVDGEELLALILQSLNYHHPSSVTAPW